MNKPLLVATMFLTVALAGCTDDATNSGADAPADGGSGGGELLQIQAPAWAVGNSWTWTHSEYELVEQFVVTAVSGSEYTMDTTTDQTAFEEDLFDHPAVGPVGAMDLSLERDGTTTKWFDFPLEAGKNWTTQLGEDSITITVLDVSASGEATLEAFDENGAKYFGYNFESASGWFTYVTEYDDAGLERGTLTVERGPDYVGEYVRASVTTLVETYGEGPHQETETFDFSDKTDADVFGHMYLNCQQGGAFVGAGPIESLTGESAMVTGISGGYSMPLDCPTNDNYYGIIGNNPDQGTWGYAVDVASEDASWLMVLWLAEYDRSTVGA